MRFLFSILLFLPFFANGAQIGWLCRVTLNETRVTLAEDGQTPTVQLTGNKYYIIKFLLTNKTTQPTLTDLGYYENRQIDGSPRPNVPGIYYIVTSPFDSYRVGDQYSDLDEFSKTQNIGPIYQSDLGNPFLTSDGWFSGVNDNFDTAAVTPLQGQTGDKFLTYSSGGTPQLSDSATDGNHWQYDESSDSWKLTSNGSSTGSTELSSVITAIGGVQSQLQSDNLALRQALISWLGANGNSWVYDCKLSLSDLQSLVSSLGGNVGLILSSVSSVPTSLSSIDYSLSSIDMKMSLISSLDSSLIQANTSLDDVNNNLRSIDSSINGLRFYDYNTKLDDIISKLQDVKDNTTASTSDFLNLPQPDFGNTSADDEIPLTGWKELFDTRNQLTFGEMVSWGNAPMSTLGNGHFDFVSSLLNVMIGSIPSVGSDPHMFDIDFTIPYVGRIQRSYNFSDWSSIQYFRTAMLWVLYLFFALAIARLFMKAFI